jgi:nucleolar complex protein 2
MAFIPYVACFPRYPINYLRALLQIWSKGEETDRIMAFLNIHKLAIATPFPFVHRCMKESYLAYVRNAKFGTAMQRGAVNFMANGVVELFLLDGVGAYQLAFVYIRQLAVHLRQALTQKNTEAHKCVAPLSLVFSLSLFSPFFLTSYYIVAGRCTTGSTSTACACGRGCCRTGAGRARTSNSWSTRSSTCCSA